MPRVFLSDCGFFDKSINVVVYMLYKIDSMVVLPVLKTSVVPNGCCNKI